MAARAVLVAAPLVIVLSVLASSHYQLYSYFRIGHADMTARDWVRRVAALTWDAAWVSWNGLEVMFDTEQVPEDSALPTIHLRLERETLERMAANLPHSAKERFYAASLLYPDTGWRRIRYRFRGRSPWHWMPDKPSLRLRLPRDEPIGLQRHINLVNPEDRAMIGNYIADELGRRLGVLSLDTQFVRLFVNGDYFGVYHQTMREDENMLLPQGRIPGPLFVGDNLQDPWAANQFEVSGATDLLKSVDPLQPMIEAMYQAHGPARFETLWSILSFEQYARWLASYALMSSTAADNFHNHLLYFDPRLGLLEPLVVDAGGHGTGHWWRGIRHIREGSHPIPPFRSTNPANR